MRLFKVRTIKTLLLSLVLLNCAACILAQRNQKIICTQESSEKSVSKFEADTPIKSNNDIYEGKACIASTDFEMSPSKLETNDMNISTQSQVKDHNFGIFLSGGMLFLPKEYQSATVGQFGVKWERNFPAFLRNLLGGNSFVDNMFYDISVGLIWKNVKVKPEYSKASKKDSDNPSSLGVCLPINIGYRRSLNDKFDAFIKAGVSWDFGTDIKVSGEFFESDNESVYLKGSDMSVNFAIGADFVRHLQVSLGGSFGLNEIGGQAFSESVKSKRLMFSVGYIF